MSTKDQAWFKIDANLESLFLIFLEEGLSADKFESKMLLKMCENVCNAQMSVSGDEFIH